MLFAAYRHLPRKQYCITRDGLYKWVKSVLTWDLFSSVFVQGYSVVLKHVAVHYGFFPTTGRNLRIKYFLWKEVTFSVLGNAWYSGRTCSTQWKDLFISMKYSTLYFILKKEGFYILFHIITSAVRELFFLVFFNFSWICSLFPPIFFSPFFFMAKTNRKDLPILFFFKL